MLGPGHLATCAKTPLHTLTAGDTGQVCSALPDVPGCAVRGQPMGHTAGTGLFALPRTQPPLSHPPDEDAGGKHDCTPRESLPQWSRSRGQCMAPSFCPFSANALFLFSLEGSTALLERQRLWQSLPLRLQDPLTGPGLRLLLPTAPFILGHLSSCAREEQWGHGRGCQSRGAARIPPGSVLGMSLALSSDRSCVQLQRNPQT